MKKMLHYIKQEPQSQLRMDGKSQSGLCNTGGVVAKNLKFFEKPQDNKTAGVAANEKKYANYKGCRIYKNGKKIAATYFAKKEKKKITGCKTFGYPIWHSSTEAVAPVQKEVINVASLTKPATVNHFISTKIISLAIIGLISLLFAVDVAFVRFAKITRTAGGHSMFHLIALLLILAAIWYSNSGLIL